MKKIKGNIYCTTSDLVDMFGVSRVTVYRWIHKRKIPVVKIFGRYYIPLEWTEKFLNLRG